MSEGPARPPTMRPDDGGAHAEHFDPHVPGIDYGVLDSLLGYGVRRAQIAIYEDFVNALAPWNITPQRFSALVVISRNPGLKLTTLAKILGIARSGAVLLIHALDALGYVQRQDSALDKRAYELALTRKGKRDLQAIIQAVKAHDHRIGHGLNEAERGHLMAMLKKVAG